MLLTQYKLWKAGIFDPFNTVTSVQSSRPLDTVILDSLSFLSKKLEFILFPTNPEISLLVASILLIIGLALLFSNKKNGLLYLWFLSPLLLVALTAKSSYHISVGVSAGFYILLASMLAKISHKTWGRVATIMFLAIYLYSNLTYLLVIKNQRGDKLSVQSGGMLGDQLDLIEKTYTDNPDRSFSIATLTGPHGMNTTWSYLYQWYGVEKYGYVPTWFGADQKGIPAGEYLTNVSHPEKTHYVIYEPNPGSSPDTREEFRELQTIYAGDPLETVIFDKLVLEKRSSVDAK